MQPPVDYSLADLAAAGNRFELWATFVGSRNVRVMAEVGVWRGEFAASLLARCDELTTYFMVDPWRHISDWNKPLNRDDEAFSAAFRAAQLATDRWASKRVILRGRTVDVADQIPDGSLDFAYVDGDHTLRGITVDLMRIWPKIRPGGVVGGDDFQPDVWQHPTRYEPSLVFPFAVYFAEAVDAPIEALPGGQFAIHKQEDGFRFTDFTDRYPETTMRSALKRGPRLRRRLRAPIRSKLG